MHEQKKQSWPKPPRVNTLLNPWAFSILPWLITPIPSWDPKLLSVGRLQILMIQGCLGFCTAPAFAQQGALRLRWGEVAGQICNGSGMYSATGLGSENGTGSEISTPTVSLSPLKNAALRHTPTVSGCF